jgi:hypothetical protein
MFTTADLVDSGKYRSHPPPPAAAAAKEEEALAVAAQQYDRVLVDAECTHDGSVKHLAKLDRCVCRRLGVQSGRNLGACVIMTLGIQHACLTHAWHTACNMSRAYRVPELCLSSQRIGRSGCGGECRILYPVACYKHTGCASCRDVWCVGVDGINSSGGC